MLIYIKPTEKKYLSLYIMFQQIVLIVAAILLILSLICIAILMSQAKKKEVYPPEVGSCPDYFVMSESDGECHNVHNLGTGAGNCATITFPPLQGRKDKQGRLARCKWAKGCGVTWDGITNQTPHLC
jgi:hypothetical protein